MTLTQRVKKRVAQMLRDWAQRLDPIPRTTTASGAYRVEIPVSDGFSFLGDITRSR